MSEIINPDKLCELVARIDTMKADMDDARSEMGSLAIPAANVTPLPGPSCRPGTR